MHGAPEEGVVSAVRTHRMLHWLQRDGEPVPAVQSQHRTKDLCLLVRGFLLINEI